MVSVNAMPLTTYQLVNPPVFDKQSKPIDGMVKTEPYLKVTIATPSSNMV